MNQENNISSYSPLGDEQQQQQSKQVPQTPQKTGVNQAQEYPQQQFTQQVPYFVGNQNVQQPQLVYYPTIPSVGNQQYPQQYPMYIYPTLPQPIPASNQQNLPNDHYHMDIGRRRSNRSSSWFGCFKGMKDWPLDKRFKVSLFTHILLLCSANLLYGFNLTFLVLCSLVSGLIAFLAYRKKSELLHGAFLGLTIIEFIFFIFAMFLAFPLWGGGIIPIPVEKSRNTEQYNYEDRPNHLKSFVPINAPLYDSKLLSKYFSQNKHITEDSKAKYGDDKKHDNEEKDVMFIFNPFPWVGYILFVIYGIYRVKTFNFSRKLVTQYREELKEKYRKEFEEQNQNSNEEQNNETIELNENIDNQQYSF